MSISCPFASHWHKNKVDSNPSMVIDLSKTPVTFKCYACKEYGHLWQLVQSYSALEDRLDLIPLYTSLIESDKPTLSSMLASATSGIDEWVYTNSSEKLITFSDRVLDRFAPVVHSLRARSYLDYRKVPGYLWDRFNLRYDEKNDRVVFPVYTQERKLCGMVGRCLNPHEPRRYYNYLDFFSGMTLGGIDHVNSASTIVVVEGFFCLLRCAAWGEELDFAPVCTWRAEMSERQAQMITSLDRNVLICYDADRPGMDGGRNAKKLLRGNAYTVKRLIPPENMDVGCMNKEKFTEFFRSGNGRI